MAQVIPMMKKFVEASGLMDLGYNFSEASSGATYVNMLNNVNALILVAENNGKIAGTVGAIIIPWIADLTQNQLSETWFWVEPEYRGRGADRLLIKELENRATGLFSVNLMAIENDYIDKTDRYYKRKGYVATERTYIKRL